MAGTIKLFGSPVKKGYVIAGGAVMVAAVGYGWYRNRQASAAAASTTDTAGTSGSTDTSGSDYGIDPATGYPEGSAADTQALAALSGSDLYGGEASYPYSTTTSYTAYSSNGQWAQAAEDYLVSSVGADPTTVAAALGKYITGQAVTADQMDVIEQAIAFDGYPPVSGPNGYPPAIQQQAGGGQTTGKQPGGHTGGGTGPGGGGDNDGGGPGAIPPGGHTGGGTGGGTPPSGHNSGGSPPHVNPGGPSRGLKGITLNQPHAISNAQGRYLWSSGHSDVYWRASDGSFVATSTGQGVGQLYTGANGWAFLQSRRQA